MTDEEHNAWIDYVARGDGMPACIYSELGKDCTDSECYACATQRHACEHDEIDYVKYQEGKSWEDDYPED